MVPGCVWTEQREKAVRAVLIGAGNVAWHIAPALEQAGVRWVQVLSRSEEHAHELASRLCSGPAYGSLDRIEQGGLDMSASLFVLAVKDEAIAPWYGRFGDCLGRKDRGTRFGFRPGGSLESFSLASGRDVLLPDVQQDGALSGFGIDPDLHRGF